MEDFRKDRFPPFHYCPCLDAVNAFFSSVIQYYAVGECFSSLSVKHVNQLSSGR